MDGLDIITPENHTVEDTDDGGAVVVIDQPVTPAPSSTFYDNLLADKAFSSAIIDYATQVHELVKQDIEAKEINDKRYAEGLKRAGLTDDIIGGMPFEGASKVVHPAILEASIDYSARVVQEHFPMSGPVRQQVDGLDEKRLNRASRITRWMNWQLVQVCRDFKEEIEKGLSQQPFSGGYYVKVLWEKGPDRPDFESITSDNIILPTSASTFNTSHRRTHRFKLIDQDFKDRVASGRYFVPEGRESGAPSITAEQTEPEKAAQQAGGQEETGMNVDGERTLYDVYLRTNIPGVSPDTVRHYILTIDAETGTPYALYRNCDEKDHTLELEHIVEFPFMRLRGPYPVSLAHILSSTTAAATGALRALLDTAHINNQTGGVRLKAAAGGSGRSADIDLTKVIDIETTGTDDIRKAYAQFQTKEPSPILFQLLGFLTEMARGIVRTSMEDTTATNTPTPVGTQMSRVEEGTRTFKSIFQRQFDAMSRLLQIVFRLNKQYLTDEIVVRQAGQQLAKAEDFQGPTDILPTADPNIYTEAQRFSQVQGLSARATGNPQYNAVEVEKTILRQLRFSEADVTRLLVQPPKPQEMNAVNENVAMMMNRPVVAFPMQDHLAHIQTHLAFLRDPSFGGSPIAVAHITPPMLEHLKQHLAFWYVTEIVKLVSQSSGMDIKELMTVNDPAVKTKLDVLFAAASAKVHQMGQQMLPNAMNAIQEAIQLLSQYAPKPPMDPSIVQMEAIKVEREKNERTSEQKQQEMEIRARENQAKLQREAEEFRADMMVRLKEMSDALESSEKAIGQQYQAQVAELQKSFQETVLKLRHDLMKSREDNATDLQIALIGAESKKAQSEAKLQGEAPIATSVADRVAATVSEALQATHSSSDRLEPSN